MSDRPRIVRPPDVVGALSSVVSKVTDVTPTSERKDTMNTMHELLMPELNELKIVERQAEAETRRRLREASEPSRLGRTGWLQLKLRRPRLHRSPTAGAA